MTLNNLTRLSCYIYLFMIINNSLGYDLEFVSVLFRHGDRFPEKFESWDNASYSKEYYPYARGELTNKGKMREFKLGEFLRNRYNSFLGDFYVASEIRARSTQYARAKASLLLVLSSLYPPKGAQKWNPSLNWQPIAFDSFPFEDDVLLRPLKCSQYYTEHRKVKESADVLREINNLTLAIQRRPDIPDKINEYISQPWRLADLYRALRMGLELDEAQIPSWATSFFDLLLDAVILDYKIASYTPKLKRLFGGTLLRNIVETMNNITDGTIEGRKIHLFSAHENNIAAFLIALGVYDGKHMPEYSSCIMVELLSKNGKYFVAVNYYKGDSSNPNNLEELRIRGCTSYPCLLQEFVNLTESARASDSEMICRPTV